jgi:hypothetical protein
VGLTRQATNTPTVSDTLVTVTLGDSDSVDEFVGSEDRGDGDFLLEQGVTPVNLLCNILATVDLDFEEVGLLLAELDLLDLSVCQNTDDGAVLLDTSELSLSGLLALLGTSSSSVVGESFLLGRVPVLVEAALDLV